MCNHVVVVVVVQGVSSGRDQCKECKHGRQQLLQLTRMDDEHCENITDRLTTWRSVAVTQRISSRTCVDDKSTIRFVTTTAITGRIIAATLTAQSTATARA